jgi:hypothetical protein
MKRFMTLMLPAVIVSMCCLAGCRESLQQGTVNLAGEELVTAAALRRHMYNHYDKTGYDYQYIFLTVLGADPSPEFMDYFDDLFPQVLPGSGMKAGRYGFDGLPQTRGVWVHFKIVDYEPVSDSEAQVSCQTLESQKEDRVIRYRMQMIDGQWKATDITGIGSEKLLQ